MHFQPGGDLFHDFNLREGSFPAPQVVTVVRWWAHLTRDLCCPNYPDLLLWPPPILGRNCGPGRAGAAINTAAWARGDTSTTLVIRHRYSGPRS